MWKCMWEKYNMKMKIFAGVLIFCISISPVVAKKGNTPHTTNKSAQVDTNKKIDTVVVVKTVIKTDTLLIMEKGSNIKSEDNVDRSTNCLNKGLGAISVLVNLITLITIIAIAIGLFEYDKWRKIRKVAERASNNIKRIEKEVQEKGAGITNQISSLIHNNIKRIEKEVQEKGAGITDQISSLIGKPSKELTEQLDELSKKIEFLENMGLPLKFQDYMNRGIALYFEGKYEIALKAFDEAIKLAPKDAIVWDNKGLMLNKLGKYEEAMQAHNKAIGLDPKNATAWYNKACIYSLKSDKNNAFKILSKAIELDANFKEQAKKDEDFESLWNDEDFKRIVG
ncbi:MAG: tetratricopeptide repeat protein [bacterium]|nr:tetratricopeptide repeat protein [bacterium]